MANRATLVTLLVSSLAFCLSADATSVPLGSIGAVLGEPSGIANQALGALEGGISSGVGSILGSSRGLIGGVSRRAAAGVGAVLGAEAGLAATGTTSGAAIGSVLGASKAAKVAGDINVVNRLTNGAVGAVNALGGGIAGTLDGFGRPLDAINAASYGAMGRSFALGSQVESAASAATAASVAAATASGGIIGSPAGLLANSGSDLAAGSVVGEAVREAGAVGAALGASSAINSVANSVVGSAAAAGAAAAASGSASLLAPVPVASPVLALDAAQAAAAANPASLGAIVNRPALAADALSNARAEASIAGADMVAHGANNARSASLASNAYRQAKLAGARDKVNIAGTIQNSARISDAAIATHDTATKAEDSLLGSELAVDSAATVLDSDAAYIPPVTNSLLRSLPYGRLGLRNIVPKPLTYPSVLLPDVWLNGAPVNYLDVPLRALPYTIGPNGQVTGPITIGGPLGAAATGAAATFGPFGQVFKANNGVLVNGMVVDPVLANQLYGQNGIISSSIFPVLANGQLEANDEVAMNGATYNAIRTGAGSSATYAGYGRTNSVGMITGSVSNSNLMPTTAIGTTYPIGSALVIEPRDSFFQDYIDNASSRQNYDEKHQ